MICKARIIVVIVLVSLMGFASQCLAQTKVEIVTDAIADLRSETPTHLSSWVATDKSKSGLTKEPVYQSASPLYGKLVIGNSTGRNEIAVVIDEADNKPPRIYIDANNNHDLTDDGSPDWPPAKDGLLFKTVVMAGTVVINQKDLEVKLPYGLLRFTDETRKRAGLFYTSQFGRTGKVKIHDKEFKVLALSSNNQGLYSDRGNVRLIIDLNNDGKFDSSKDSKESFEPGELFFLDGEAYRFMAASEMGDRVTLSSLPLRMPDKWKAAVGDKIADFGFKTLDGKDLKLSDFKGKKVLLIFSDPHCGPCDALAPDLEWDLSGSPCEDVVVGHVRNHLSGLAKRFPAAPAQTSLTIESYLGIPLTATDGKVLGYLRVFDPRPMPADPRRLSFIQIFGELGLGQLVDLGILLELHVVGSDLRGALG